MFKTETEFLKDGRVIRHQLRDDDQPLSHARVMEGWQQDAGFRDFFIELLAGAPFAAFFWETPPVTGSSQDQAFEFVLVDSPQLAGVSADREAFGEHFHKATPARKVVTFWNLGHDALLVAPCPDTDSSAYAHLAAFSRKAPKSRQHDFWRAVGAAMSQHVRSRPLWLSTSGLGVYWLHVRLDTYPKYYTFAPYRQPR